MEINNIIVIILLKFIQEVSLFETLFPLIGGITSDSFLYQGLGDSSRVTYVPISFILSLY